MPKFKKPGRKFIIKWNGGKDENGTIYMPYPQYYKDVLLFFQQASSEYWSDHNYLTTKTCRMIKSDSSIKNANLKQLKSMITFCTRGERFCDGHWGSMLEQGRVVLILERLKSISEEAINS